MTGFQQFILALLGIFAVVGFHRRTVRAHLVRDLVEEQLDAEEIALILMGFDGELEIDEHDSVRD